MNAVDILNVIDDIVFVNKKNKYNISMIYNYKSDITWDESFRTKEIKLLDYSDWRVPTLSELKWICLQKGLLSSLKAKYEHTFSTLEYRWIWSKTEANRDTAFMVYGADAKVDIKDYKRTYADVIYIR